MRVIPLGHAGLLIETNHGSILCDPWFVPAFFGSWFPFPRNDQLPQSLLELIEHPDYLYVSHIHGDHLDEAFLAGHVDKATPVLLPGFPTRELERRLRDVGFRTFVRTDDGEEIALTGDLRVAIHVETSISDGPGGDSALMVADGTARLVNQNDCRPADPRALGSHGPVDLHFLQFSGAIWYPMVYEETPETMRVQCESKVDSQFARAMRYVEELDAGAVVPSAGPPCFLDPDLFHLNVITGDELSIFPDQTAFLRHLAAAGRDKGVINVPGTVIEVIDGEMTVTQPRPDVEIRAIFDDKAAYLARYQADWSAWMAEQRSSWLPAAPGLLERLADWWEPLLAMAPTLCSAVGASVLVRADDVEVLIDFPEGEVRAYAGEPYRYRFEIARELVETVVASHAVDWSNALFLSLRFRAWRDGPFNEYVYNFFKSLSVERMRRTEAEARRKLLPPADDGEEIAIGDYLVERYCPHRHADLSVFAECDGDVLTCTLHGWKFKLSTGECLTATDRSLRVRRAPASSAAAPTGLVAEP